MTTGTEFAFCIGGMLQPTDIKRRKQGRLADNAGFSFIDLMLAMVVLTIGVLALADLQIASSTGNSSIKSTGNAANIAAQRLEEIKGMVYANVAAEAPIAVPDPDGMTFTREVQVTNNSPIANTKTVTVIVTWTDKTGAHKVSLATILAL